LVCFLDHSHCARHCQSGCSAQASKLTSSYSP
jgi:hypothetical protein